MLRPSHMKVYYGQSLLAAAVEGKHQIMEPLVAAGADVKFLQDLG